MLRKIVQWVIYSSKRPNEISLSLKAGIPLIALIGLGPYISTADATTLVDAFVNGLVAAGQIVTAVGTAYGVVRKIYLSFFK